MMTQCYETLLKNILMNGVFIQERILKEVKNNTDSLTPKVYIFLKIYIFIAQFALK